MKKHGVGPGRGAGNSINALLDGYRVTLDRKYVAKAEALIQRCIHPHDCINDQQLHNVELRWSYTVFLQNLGKYLDFKVGLQEFDGIYAYARASLLHYATWMSDHEVPYTQVFDRVEFPTETWPAQDIRKSNVFKYAAKYADSSSRELFLGKAEMFFRSSVSDLLSFETSRLTRPIVLLLVNGYMQAYFQQHPEESVPPYSHGGGFGCPPTFTPQLHELYKAKEWIQSRLALLKSWNNG